MTTGSASQKLSFEFDASGVGTVTTALDRIRAAMGDIEAATTRAMSKVAALTTDLNAAAAAASALKSAAGKIDVEAPGLAAIARDLSAVSAGLAAVRSGAGPAIGGLDSAATGAAGKIGVLSTAIGKLVAAIAGIRSPIDIDIRATGASAAETALSRIAAAVAALRASSVTIDIRATGAPGLASDLSRISSELSAIRTTGATAFGGLSAAMGGAATRAAALASSLGAIVTALGRIGTAASSSTITVRVTGDAAAITALNRLAAAVDRLIAKLTRLVTTLTDVAVALRSVATAAGAAATALSSLTSAMPPPSSAATVSSIASSLSSVSTAAGSASSGAQTLTSRLAAAGAAGSRALGGIVGLLRQAAGLALRVGSVSVGGAAAAGGALGLSAKDSADDIVKTARLSSASGFSGGVRQYAGFIDAAALNGIERDDVAGALEGLQDNYIQARLDPTSDLARGFERLGIQLRSDTDEARRLEEIQRKINELRKFGASPGADVDAIQSQIDALERARRTSIVQDMLPTDELVMQLAEGFRRMGNSPARSSLASMLIGGDDGIRLIPFLEQGADGIRQAVEDAASASGELTDAQIQAAFAVERAFGRISLGFRGVRREILALLGPDIAEKLNEVTAFLANNRTAIAAWAKFFVERIASVATDIGTLITGSGDQLKNQWLAGLTGVAAAIRNVFGELFAWITGQPSAIPEWISQAREVLSTEFNALFADFVAVYERDIKPILDAFNSIIEYITGFAADLSAVFTNLYKPIEAFVEPVLAFLRELTGAENNRQLFTLIGLLAPLGGALRAVFAVVSRLWPVIVAIGDALAGVVTVIRTFPLPSLAAIGTALVEGFTGAISTSIVAWKDLFAGFWDWLRTTAADVGRSVGEALSAAGRFLGLSSPAAPSSTPSSPPGFADGGAVTGPGGPTSDSILARLSTGEFVVRAAAVRQYGVDFLSRINSLRLPGFATGGFVGALSMPRMSVPSLAGIGGDGGGGMGAGLTLVLPSGQSVAARTSDAGIRDIKAALQRTARVSSSGSQPAWR